MQKWRGHFATGWSPNLSPLLAKDHFDNFVTTILDETLESDYRKRGNTSDRVHNSFQYFHVKLLIRETSGLVKRLTNNADLNYFQRNSREYTQNATKRFINQKLWRSSPWYNTEQIKFYLPSHLSLTKYLTRFSPSIRIRQTQR